MVFSVDDSPYFTVNCACAAYTVGYCGSTNGWFTSNPGGAQVDTLSPPPPSSPFPAANHGYTGGSLSFGPVFHF